MPQTSPVVRHTTDRLLDEVRRDSVSRTHAGQRMRPIPRMRPYAEQLAHERTAD